MTKIKLGVKPKTFKPVPVKFLLPDGSEGCIEATFHYRTRSEFGVMLDELYKAAGEAVPPDGVGQMEHVYVKAGEQNAAFLGKALAAWNLDDEPLSPMALAALCEEVPAAAMALMAAYSAACTEGRLGN